MSNRLVSLSSLVRGAFPDIDAVAAIRSGQVEVDGLVRTNPNTLIRADSRVAIRRERSLRGSLKLDAALVLLAPNVTGRIAVDVGAAAGGFTASLLGAGARRVYAVDVGYGQLIGSLRQDPRVVVLERTNLASLDPAIVPDEVGFFTLDLSYLALAEAIPQLNQLRIDPQAELIGLLKPTFELRSARLPSAEEFPRAIDRASTAARQAGWKVIRTVRSPVEGGRGAVEFFLHARRLSVA
jgi:23S rRNA (cytidine1920-2'-O)/16S rRNA (cytidine1409-2'-O)-methyltransferase